MKTETKIDWDSVFEVKDEFKKDSSSTSVSTITATDTILIKPITDNKDGKHKPMMSEQEFDEIFKDVI